MAHVPKTGTQAPDFRVRSEAGSVSFGVVVVPRASRSRITGIHGDSLKVTLAAPPVDGEANAELCRVLAKALGVPQRAVQITQGQHSKHKTVAVLGATVEQVCGLTRNDGS